jgi:acetyl-CoA carboxylase biotin carboxyl carrier protein
MAKSKSSKSAAPRAAAGEGAFTDTQRVKELIELMAANGLSEIELVEGAKKIALRRGVVSGGAAVVAAPVAHHAAPAAMPAAQPAPTAPAAAPAAAKSADDGLTPIKSPMVGTFYSAANPDADPFVSVGSQVTAKTTVCIIEAMKVFNEIPAEVSGTVAKVLVSNGQVVEYGQPLFLVKPA